MANLPENDDIEISPTFSLDSLPDDQAEDQAKDQAHLMTIQDEYSQKSSTPNQRFCIGFDSSMHFAGTSTVNVNFTDCGRDITNLLTQHLPPYVVSCFLAAGYDTLDVIADMSVSSKPGNSLEVVEKYINDQYPGDIKFTHMGAKTCKFPPGHISRIAKFVQNVKEDIKTPLATTKKRGIDECGKATSNNKSKRRKISSTKSKQNPRDLFSNIRANFSKWKRSQSQDHQNLKENTDFTIKIELDEGNDGYKTEIRCKCGSNILLPTANNKVIISNWTRHILKNCHVTKAATDKQTSMIKYLPLPQTSSKELNSFSSSTGLNSSSSSTLAPDARHQNPAESKQDFRGTLLIGPIE